MKWWSSFWKRRKQNDRIKIQLICFLIGMVCLGTAVHQGFQLYQMIMSPVEYILTGTGSSEQMDDKFQTMKQFSYVDAISRQQEVSLILTCPWGELSVPCLELSEEYLETAYGLSDSSAMKVIYLNQPAYEQLLQLNQYSSEEEGEIENCRMGYSINEENNGMAIVIPVLEGIPNDTPYAFSKGDSVNLRKNATNVRIRLRKQDLDGMQVQELQRMGFGIVNEGDVEENRLLREIQFLHIKYDLLIAVLCFLFLGCFKKYGNKS